MFSCYCFIGMSSLRPVGRLRGVIVVSGSTLSEELTVTWMETREDPHTKTFRALFLPKLLNSTVALLWGCSAESE